jgi:hypothetical protein
MRWGIGGLLLALAMAAGCADGIKRSETRVNMNNSWSYQTGTCSSGGICSAGTVGRLCGSHPDCDPVQSGASRPHPRIAVGPTEIVGVAGNRLRVKHRASGTETTYCMPEFTGCAGDRSTEKGVWYDNFSGRWFLMNVQTTDQASQLSARQLSGDGAPQPGAFCLAVSNSSAFPPPASGPVAAAPPGACNTSTHTCTAGNVGGTCLTDGDCGVCPSSCLEDGCGGIERPSAHWKAFTLYTGYARFGIDLYYPSYPDDARMAVNRNTVVLTGVPKNANTAVVSQRSEGLMDRSIVIAVDKASLLARKHISGKDYATDNSICTGADTPYTCCDGFTAGVCTAGTCTAGKTGTCAVHSDCSRYEGQCERIPGYSYFEPAEATYPRQWVMVPAQTEGTSDYCAANANCASQPVSAGQTWLIGQPDFFDSLNPAHAEERVMVVRGVPPSATIAMDEVRAAPLTFDMPVGAPQRGTTQTIGLWRGRPADVKANGGRIVTAYTTLCAHTDPDSVVRLRSCIQWKTYTELWLGLRAEGAGVLSTRGRYYYSPSISIADRGNKIVVVANGSGNSSMEPHSLNEGVRSYAAGRLWTDPVGTLSNLTRIWESASDPYGYFTNCNGGGCGAEPWGRYSSIAADPLTDIDHVSDGHVDWLSVTEYPIANGSAQSHEWGTRVVKIGS